MWTNVVVLHFFKESGKSEAKKERVVSFRNHGDKCITLLIGSVLLQFDHKVMLGVGNVRR